MICGRRCARLVESWLGSMRRRRLTTRVCGSGRRGLWQHSSAYCSGKTTGLPGRKPNAPTSSSLWLTTERCRSETSVWLSGRRLRRLEMSFCVAFVGVLFMGVLPFGPWVLCVCFRRFLPIAMSMSRRSLLGSAGDSCVELWAHESQAEPATQVG